jgi:hypothetical protein
LRERAAELERLGVTIYAVTFESQARIAAFRAATPLPFPLLRDPEREVYRAFGLGRRPLTTIWGPATAWYYARNLLQGRLPARSSGSDRYQLGGDVILKADRSGGWVYRSRHPADRPAFENILAIAGRAGK